MDENYLPKGYAPERIEQLWVTLVFKEDINSFRRIFDLSIIDSCPWVKYGVNCAHESSYRIATKPHFEGAMGFFIIASGDDGWIYVHTNPKIASRFIGQYENKEGLGKYKDGENLFAVYFGETIKAKIAPLSQDLDNLEAKIGRAKEKLLTIQKGFATLKAELTDVVGIPE